MYYVYVLSAEKNNKSYTVSSSDPAIDFFLTTKKRQRDSLFATAPEDYSDRGVSLKAEALKREKWLKTAIGRDFMKALSHQLFGS